MKKLRKTKPSKDSTEQVFEMFAGPSHNSYIAPSGHTYRVEKDRPFVVTGTEDIEYFTKKTSCFKNSALSNTATVEEKKDDMCDKDHSDDEKEIATEKVDKENPEVPKETKESEDMTAEEEKSVEVVA